MTFVGESPKIIAIGWYDGPTEGLLQISKTGQEYYFICLVTILGEEHDLRGIKLFPLPSGTFASFLSQLTPEMAQENVIVIMGDLYASIKEELEVVLDVIHNKRGELEKLVAWYAPGGTILAETLNDLNNDVALIDWVKQLAPVSR